MTQVDSPGFLIDLDGLLINSEELSQIAFKKVCTELACEFTEDFHASIRGKQKSQWAKDFVHSFALTISSDEVARMHESYLISEMDTSVECMPGAVEILSWMALSGYKRILVTSSSRGYAEKYLRKLNLDKFFSAIVAADDVKNGKPDPEPYRLAAMIIGLEPSQCIVLEDSINGAIAGKRAGATVIGVPSAYFDKEGMEVADKVVSSLFEALKSLKLMGL